METRKLLINCWMEISSKINNYFQEFFFKLSQIIKFGRPWNFIQHLYTFLTGLVLYLTCYVFSQNSTLRKSDQLVDYRL